MHNVVAAVLVHEGRALLGHRSPDRQWYPDVWDVLGGHVDGDESPEQALVRELDEELGISVDVNLGELVARIVDPAGQGGGLDITILIVTSWRGDIHNRAPDEHDELRWFDRDEVRSLRLAHPRPRTLLNDVLLDHAV